MVEQEGQALTLSSLPHRLQSKPTVLHPKFVQDILKWIWPYNRCKTGHYPLIRILIVTTSPRGRFTTGLWREPRSAGSRRVSFKIHRMYNWRAKCTQIQSIEISLFIIFINSRVLYSQFFFFFLQGRNCSKNWKALNCDKVRCYYSLSSQ